MRHEFKKRAVETNGMDRTSTARWKRIWKNVLPKGKKGARLLDAGCGEHVWTCTDYEVVRADNWQPYRNRRARMPKGITNVDLCAEPWPWDDNAFSAVVAVDVIEHLENIWAFFRQALRVASRHVIVATPNTASPLSKALYQENGRLWAFTVGEVRHSKHVSPIFDWQLVEAARRAGWHVTMRAYTDEAYKALGAVPPSIRHVAMQRPTQRSVIARMQPA